MSIRRWIRIKVMKIAIVRGGFLNQYEGQMFYPLSKKYEITAFSSVKAIHSEFPFPVVKLPSPMDISFGPFDRLKMPILNRLFVDAHWLIGLEEKLAGFDVAHCADTYFHFTNQCIQAKKRGKVKKVVATIWENIPFNNEGIWGRKQFKKEAIENIDHFIAISNRAKETLILEGVGESRISVCGMKIDTSRFKPKTKKHNKKELQILFVGRLEFYKGIYDIAYAAKRLLEDRQLSKYKLAFSFVGDGSQKDKLIQTLHRLGIADKISIQSVKYDEMPSVFQKADIFVAPSRETPTWQEQFSAAILEAQACGLPIVTTNSGAIPENIDDAGILANPGDFYSISEGLKKLILYSKLREELGEKARKHALKMDVKAGAAELDQIYQSVMS